MAKLVSICPYHILLVKGKRKIFKSRGMSISACAGTRLMKNKVIKKMLWKVTLIISIQINLAPLIYSPTSVGEKNFTHKTM